MKRKLLVLLMAVVMLATVLPGHAVTTAVGEDVSEVVQVPVDVTVRVKLENTGDIYYGDRVTLVAEVAANGEYTVSWEYLNVEPEEPVWVTIGSGETYAFEVNVANAARTYRAVVNGVVASAAFKLPSVKEHVEVVEPEVTETPAEEPEAPAEEPEAEEPEAPAEEPESEEPEAPAEEPESEEPETPAEEPEVKEPEAPAEEPEVKEPEAPAEEPEVKEPEAPAEESEVEEPEAPAEEPEAEEPEAPAEEPEAEEPEAPAEEPESEEPEVPAEEPESEEPEVPAEEPESEEPEAPAEEPEAEEPEAPAEEPEDEEPEAPAEESESEEPEVPTEEPTEEPEEVEEPAEEPEAALNPDRSIEIRVIYDGDELSFGDEVTLVAELNGYENTVYELQWQMSLDNAEWTDVADATGASYTMAVTEENYYAFWRVIVTVKEILPAE